MGRGAETLGELKERLIWILLEPNDGLGRLFLPAVFRPLITL